MRNNVGKNIASCQIFVTINSLLGTLTLDCVGLVFEEIHTYLWAIEVVPAGKKEAMGA